MEGLALLRFVFVTARNLLVQLISTMSKIALISVVAESVLYPVTT
jgi:hypothetical protein